MAAPVFTLIAPNGQPTSFQAISGTIYNTDANGILSNVPIGDIASLTSGGFRIIVTGRNNLTATTTPGATNDSSQDYAVGSRWFNQSTGIEWACLDATVGAAVWVAGAGSKFPVSSMTKGANGLYATPLALSAFKNLDGSGVAAAPGAGVFGFAITLATSAALIGETSNNNTKTDDAIIEYVLPPWYVAGSNLTVTVHASIITAGAPTYAAKTAQIKAYKTASDGTQGADIGPAAASAITVAGADLPFVITGTTLNPGDRLMLELETILHDTGAVACHAAINSVRIS